MRQNPDISTVETIKEASRRVLTYDDYDDLIERIGDRSLVLIGEATHGSHEFYQHRAEITKQLIEKKGFRAVAVEADWPHAYEIHRYLTGAGDSASAEAALGGFGRFPVWMWGNEVVLSFARWLRAFNARQFSHGTSPVGFYGLDLYSMYSSIQAVLEYLEKHDPEAARRARYRYSCLGHFDDDSEAYGYAASFDLEHSCEDEVVQQLVELLSHRSRFLKADGLKREEAYFQLVQNARLVKNAEKYYRAMFGDRTSSWNIRDTHMFESLQALQSHLNRDPQTGKIVVWAHNSHVGDASGTEMGQQGEISLGQLAREAYPDDTFLLGFTTYSGTVTAASEWGEAEKVKKLTPALPGSHEDLFHRTGIRQFFVPLQHYDAVVGELRPARLQRAIGVIYRPESERISHYYYARLSDQFDAVIHLDRTTAVTPLKVRSRVAESETPETYPSAL